MKIHQLTTIVCLSFVACTPAAQPVQSPPAPTQATFADQVAAGQKLYADNCASCHGDAGQGGTGPRLVGLKNGALPLDPPPGAKTRKAKFKRVADVVDFVVAKMPPDGALPEGDDWAILAFDLKANGIDLGDKRLDRNVASTLVIPR
jgi:cytochrome c